MTFDLKKYLGEATEYDKKERLEEKEPLSWLKSVVAFANTDGGALIYGIADDDTVVGLDDPKYVSDKLSEFIRNRVDPSPEIQLSFETVKDEDNSEKVLIILYVHAGSETPYFYRYKGEMLAFTRVGNSSVKADAVTIRRLSLKGSNKSWDSLVSEYNMKDFSFSRLKSMYHSRAGKSFEDDMFQSWEICNADGQITNAGLLLSDDCPIKYSRLFCTRWAGNNMSGGSFDAIDSAEYQGNVLALLEAAETFVKKHNNLRWKKLPNSRIDLPDYIERPIHEALVNAFVHRDYMEIGSEVHLDIFDNRIEITSPGGMVEGLPIQKRDLYHIASRRRNPYLADIFHRLQLMERSGSGIKEIMNDYKASANITEDRLPTFFSDESDFNVTFWNLNYGVEQSESKGSNREVSDKVSD
ncbi:MAG TPA: AAA family ATPase, partial [Lachnospiraceae bacterium]|nr:AAA family ATPase [Lachnospiraceae bacterium]